MVVKLHNVAVHLKNVYVANLQMLRWNTELTVTTQLFHIDLLMLSCLVFFSFCFELYPWTYSEKFHLVPECAPISSWLDRQKLTESPWVQNVISVTCPFLDKQIYFICDNLENLTCIQTNKMHKILVIRL